MPYALMNFRNNFLSLQMNQDLFFVYELFQ
jgi:hypothetical protein